MKIGAIRATPEKRVGAIEISAIMGKINDIQNSNAGAVEEQSATTAEMSRNVSKRQGQHEIAQNINACPSAADTASAPTRRLIPHKPDPKLSEV